MRPFSALALGLVIIVLTVTLAGFDLLVDPVGWVLVLVGVRQLPEDYPLRTWLQYAAALALLVSVPLAAPPVRRAVAEAEPAVGWAVSLPSLAVIGLLAHAIAVAATDAGHRRAATPYRVVVLGAGLVAALPVLVFALGLDGLAGLAALLVVVVPVLLLALLFLHSDRPWSGWSPDAAEPTGAASS